MPDEKEISALTTAEQTSNNDLLETSIPNAMTDTGYISRKQSVTMLEQQMLGNTQYNTELPNFTAGNRTIFKALEEARSSGGGGASVIQKTMAEYTALPSADKMNGSIYKITDKALIYCLDEEYHAVLEITSADYALLSSDEKNNGTLYIITDEETTADDIPYSAGVSVADKLDSLNITTITHTITKDSGVWSIDESSMKKTGNVVSLYIKFKGSGSIASGVFSFQGNLNVGRPLLDAVCSVGCKGASPIVSIINSDGNIYVRNASPSAIDIGTGDFSICFTYITAD